MPKSQETVHYARNGSPSEVLNVCVQADIRRFWREILEWAMDSDVYHLTENRLNYIRETSDYPTRLDEIKSYSFHPRVGSDCGFYINLEPCPNSVSSLIIPRTLEP